VIRIRVWIPADFFIFFTVAEWEIFFDICWHFSYSQRSICTILSEMTDADKIMHPQHFGIGLNPTDIRIRINPKIRIWIKDYFRLKFWRWRKFALSECFCSFCHSFVLSVSRITHERVNGRRPNMVGIGAGNLLKWLIFSVDPNTDPDVDLGSVFHFP